MDDMSTTKPKKKSRTEMPPATEENMRGFEELQQLLHLCMAFYEEYKHLNKYVDKGKINLRSLQRLRQITLDFAEVAAIFRNYSAKRDMRFTTLEKPMSKRLAKLMEKQGKYEALNNANFDIDLPQLVRNPLPVRKRKED